jgi:glycerate kinase
VRILLAPDSFGDTLSAQQAAEALARGWDERDVIDLAPMSDGGPGFVDVLSGCGDLWEVVVPGPLGVPVLARWRLDGTTAYVESAQACGLHLVTRNDPEAATTRGVGLMLIDALAAGATRIVVGLGGSATTDGGAGLLSVVDAVPDAVEVIAATDVDNPLLGEHGAAAVYGPQKGADPATVARLEARLRVEAAGHPEADLPGAGAAGGLGFALFRLGAVRASGATLVADRIGLADRMAAADLVITGEGRYDHTSARGKVVGTVARLARARGVPCIVTAGSISDAASAPGVTQAHALVDLVGADIAFAEAGSSLERLARQIAGRWERR